MPPECCAADAKMAATAARRCGLYFGLAGRIQELKKRTDAPGPSGFVVLAAFDALVVQVLAELPALLQEHVAKLFDVLHDARTFARADVQPDTRARTDVRSCREAMHHLLVPPNGRRESGKFSEDVRKPQPQVERDQAAERRAADACFLGAGKSAVFLLDKGLQLQNQEFCITIGASASESGHAGRRVFANPCFPCVVDANDD